MPLDETGAPRDRPGSPPGRGRVDRHLLPALLRQPGARAARRRDRPRGGARRRGQPLVGDLAVIREYERTSTTVVNAYVMTAMRDYLGALEEALRALGYPGRLFVMQSGGGIATAETMAALPRAHDRIRAGRRRPHGRGVRRAHGPRRPRRLRHGRDDREALPDRRRQPADHPRVRAAPDPAPARERHPDEHPGHRPGRDRRRRRLDRARRDSASCASAPTARAPRPGPSATAAAGPRRR